MDVDLQQVDYNNPMVLKAQMKHVKCVIVVPDHTENRVANACNIIDAASMHGVKRMQLTSLIGCDYAGESTPMGGYYAIEGHLRTMYAYGRWCVLRLPMVHQLFYFWSRMVTQDKCVGMPISPDTEFTVIDIKDVCDAMVTMLLSPRKQDVDTEDLLDIPDAAVKRIYDLTGTCPYTGNAVAYKLNDALSGEAGEITFQEMDEENFRRYLENLAQPHPPTQDPQYRRDPFRPDPRRVLTPATINLMMDCFRVARETMQMGIVKDDARNLIGRQPKDLSQFFIDNQDQFRFRDEKID
ncbi:hypothetical protein K492DRAFT_223258 [Lichtheimia hyalospora FSU 10163]|nr:hypothetical protein K492DRAFT_223258 [Lichtheimia hyalospora FSU 10163]